MAAMKARPGARVNFKVYKPATQQDGQPHPTIKTREFTVHQGEVWSMGPRDRTRWVIPDEKDLAQTTDGCRVVDVADIEVISEVRFAKR